MADEQKTPDSFMGVPGGITGRDGKYPLVDRRRDQGYDVDAVGEDEEEVVQPVAAQEELTDPPGQPVTNEPNKEIGDDEPQPETPPVEDTPQPEGAPPSEGVPPSEEEPTEGGAATSQASPTEPWSNMTRHEQIDTWMEEEEISRPEEWSHMTIPQKKKWLDENA